MYALRGDTLQGKGEEFTEWLISMASSSLHFPSFFFFWVFYGYIFCDLICLFVCKDKRATKEASVKEKRQGQTSGKGSDQRGN